MKKAVMTCLSAAICLLVLSVVAIAQSRGDIHLHKSCKYCGMDREKFDLSRMLIEYDDNTTVATCSIHCAAVDLANNIDKSPRSIKVADFNTRDLIDAEKAVWVIGGSRPGVMSKRGKWAFSGKDGAEGFAKTNGGTIGDFETAMKAAYEDMYSDTKMIRDKRKMKRSQNGMHEHKH